MREETFMNQEIIKVTLLAPDENTDVLRFSFNDGEIDINLNDAGCQNDMKRMFSVLLKCAIHADITLEFQVAPEYSRGMYIEVCEEYIKDLNRELSEVTETIRAELKA